MMSTFATAKLRADQLLTDVLADKDLAVQATYKRFSGLERDESTKNSTPLYDELEGIPFIRDLSMSSASRLAAEAAGVELQEYRGIYTTLLKYVSDEKDGSDLSLNDLIIDNGHGLKVRFIRPVLGTVVKFVCSVDGE